MKSERLSAVAGTLVLALLAGLVWLAHHPEHPLLVRAADWPLIGSTAARFRHRFQPPDRDPAVEVASPVERIVLTVEVPEPDGEPDQLQRVAVEMPASAVRPIDEGRSIDRSVEPVLPLGSSVISNQRLTRVRRLLGANRVEGRLGPYAWIAPFEPPVRWQAIARELDGAFSSRTGLKPHGTPVETVVAFSDRERYRELLRAEPLLAGLDPDGHSIAGMAALVAADPQSSVTEAVLVHELTHLVSRRALGPALPAWLAEGLAEDLAWSAFEPSSGFRFDLLRVGVGRSGRSIHLDGAVAALERLTRALDQGRLPSLDRLVAVEPDGADSMPPLLRYSAALWFVRFLFESEFEPGFRQYLRAVAAGGDSGAAALARSLGSSLVSLEPEFLGFVRARKRSEVDAAIEAIALPGEEVVPFQEGVEPSGSSSRQDEPPSS